MGKKKGKDILMPPFDVDWPTVDADTEEKIVSALTQKLQEFPSPEIQRTKAGRLKSGQPPATPRPECSEEEEQRRRARLSLTRQQLAIGYREVCRALERDQISLVLGCGEAQPPILLRSLLPLVARRQPCAAVCLSAPGMSARITAALGINCLLVVGFKRPQACESSDFEDFVSMVTELAPPLSLKDCSPKPEDGSGVMEAEKCGDTEEGGTSAGDEKIEDKSADETAPVSDQCHVMEPEQEQEVMEKLLTVVKPYLPVLQKPRAKLTPQELTTRRTVNSWMNTDLATVREAIISGQLDVLLLRDAPSPQHPLVESVVQSAREKGCPVVLCESLKTRMAGVIRDKNFRVVGFRKSPEGGTPHPEEFRQFVTSLLHHLSPHPHPPASDTSKTPAPEEGTRTQPGCMQKRRKSPPPVWDVSSLYVYKKDTDQETQDSPKSESMKTSSTTESFISLSSEPTVQYLGVKSLGDESVLSGIAVIDSKGSGVSGRSLMAQKSVKTETNPVVETTDSAGFSGVMGLDSVDAPSVSLPIFAEPRMKKPKASLKRALDRSEERGEFVSFGIRPTKVQTSVPNPSKKRKVKKNKKR